MRHKGTRDFRLMRAEVDEEAFEARDDEAEVVKGRCIK